MKRTLIILALVVLVVGGLTVPAFAGSEGVVNVTAEVAQVSVTVNPNNVSYGLVPLNTTGLKPVGDPFLIAWNTGNCFVDMLIRGDDTTNWALDTEEPIQAGPDLYVHYFGEFYLTPSYTPLTHLNQDLGIWDSYPPGGMELFKLQMDTPTTSTATGTQTTTVTVIVTYQEEGIWVVLDAGGPYANSDTTLTLTANVTDEHHNPVTGLTTEKFTTQIWSGVSPNFTVVTDPVFTETWVENGGGIYTGSITDISPLTDGPYLALIVIDSPHKASATDAFTISP